MTEDNNATQLGVGVNWVGGQVPCELRRADRRQHLYVIGQTGTGKTTLLRNLLIQDIEAGLGVGLLDPHGDLAADLLNYIPRRRSKDVIYFDPSDLDFPMPLDLFQRGSTSTQHVINTSIIGALRNIWQDSWGPRMEYVLTHCLAALLECENTSLLGVPRLLTDAGYRDWALKQVNDPMTLSFFRNELGSWDKRFLAEVIAPIQNKVGALLHGPLRRILGQVRGRFTPRFVMDNGKIFIANLSKGKLGESETNLLGAILISQFQTAAMERAAIPEEERTDFFLYVDEFQNFATDSFSSILSESRKYHLGLTLGHQYLDQIRPDIRDAVFGNCGSFVSFRTSQADTQRLSRQFGGKIDDAFFANLPNRRICARLLRDGQTTDPIVANTLAPLGHRNGRRDVLIRQSRERYAVPLERVDDKIERWFSRKF